MCGYVLTFGKVGRSWILGRAEIGYLSKYPMRWPGVNVASVVIRWSGRVAARIYTGEWIDPCPRSQVRPRIQTSRVWIRTTRAEIRSANAIAAKITDIVGKRREGMFHTRLTDLLKAVIVGRSAAHSIKILRDH